MSIMTFSYCIDSRYTSGSKSLSSIIGKYNVDGNFTYDMYSQLYDACVNSNNAVWCLSTCIWIYKPY